MLNMPVGRDPVGGGVRATDVGGGTHLPGATEGAVPVQEVWGGYGDEIFDGAQSDTASASDRGETEMETLATEEAP